MRAYIAGFLLIGASMMSIVIHDMVPLSYLIAGIERESNIAIYLFVVLVLNPLVVATSVTFCLHTHRPRRAFACVAWLGPRPLTMGILTAILTYGVAAVLITYFPRGPDAIFPAASAAIVATGMFFVLSGDPPGRCRQCQYDIRASLDAGRCPECGTAL